MIYFDLKMNEEDLSMVELWQTLSGKKYLGAIIHIDMLNDDKELLRRLEDGETVPVTMRVMS